MRRRRPAGRCIRSFSLLARGLHERAAAGERRSGRSGLRRLADLRLPTAQVPGERDRCEQTIPGTPAHSRRTNARGASRLHAAWRRSPRRHRVRSRPCPDVQALLPLAMLARPGARCQRSAAAAPADAAATQSLHPGQLPARADRGRPDPRSAKRPSPASCAQVRRECPLAAAGSPQDPESTQMSNEVIGAMVTSAIRPRPARDPRIPARRPARLRWSNRGADERRQGYVGKLKTMSSLAVPDVCARRPQLGGQRLQNAAGEHGRIRPALHARRGWRSANCPRIAGRYESGGARVARAALRPARKRSSPTSKRARSKRGARS